MRLVILALLALTITAKLTFNHAAKNMIEEINADPSSTWVAGENEHWNYFPVEDIKNLMGTKTEPEILKLEPLD